MELQIAKRPQVSNSAVQGIQQCQLLTNYYKFESTDSKKQNVFKYAVSFEPDVPDNSHKLRSKICRLAREEMNKLLNFHIFYGSCLYSRENVQELPVFNAKYDEQDYKINVTWVQCIQENDPDMMVFYKMFFNSMLRKIKFKQIGRNFFNPEQSHHLANHGIEIWPGFSAAINVVETGVMINIDIVHKVLRKDTVLEFINETQNRCRGDPKQEIRDKLIGQTVMTKYNKRTYKIDDIEFDKTPRDTFEQGSRSNSTTADGTDQSGTSRGSNSNQPISFYDYYKSKYSAQLQDQNQPLIVNKNPKTGNLIYLIPELCTMTGLTDSMRANFGMMKEMGQITHARAEQRIKESEVLISRFKQGDKLKEEMQKWQLQISNRPHKIDGKKMNPGNMIMGRNQQQSLANERDLDRFTQKPMLEMPKLQRWGIFYSQRDQQALNSFNNSFQQCIRDSGFPCDPPRSFEVRGNGANAWISELRKNLNPQVQAVVLILPGSKGKCREYDEVKKVLIKEMPVPSQVVLAGTITRGKNVRSIVSKIILQIVAKIGGEPWAIDNMPFTDQPTMVCGMDVYHNVGKGKSMLAFVATYNRNFTKYWSDCKVQNEGQEISDCLQSIVRDAASAFKSKNGIFPKRIIIYRDGVGESQRKVVLMNELPQIKQGLKELGIEESTKVMLVLVNKRISQRFYKPQGNQVFGPDQGTLVDAGVVNNETYEFFLVSAAGKQGVASPAHYVVLYDQIGESPDKIQKLTHKLCYAYYNVSAAVKVPAPIQYAHRLANLIGDRAKGPGGAPIPHAHFKNTKTLYFI